MSKIQSSNEDDLAESQKKESLFKIFINLLVCTFQTAFGYICLDLCVTISLHYIVNELGEIANSGYGLAMTCINIIILPVGFGFNQSLNMHTSQALGDKKISLAKRFFNINFYAMLMVLVPLALLILSILKYPLSLTIEEETRDETSDYALEFLFYLIPAVLLALEFEGAKIFMVAHKVTYPFIYIHFTTFLLHWFFTWLFMVQFQWKVFGAGLAIILTEIYNIIGLLAFIQFTNIKKEIFQGVTLPFNMKRFKKLGFSYIKTSVPLVLHILSEFFVFFLLSFVALSLGTAPMNAHLGIQNICGIFFKIPLSLSLALMSFVGTEMGCGNIKKAKVYVMIGSLLFAIMTVTCSLFLSFFRENLASFFSNENDNKYGKETYQLFIDTVPWLIAGVIVADGLQGSLSGALKGINLVNFVFYSTLLAYYVVCIPIVCYFAYGWGLGNGVVGIWQGFGVANVLLAALFITLLFTTNWEKESIKILNRVKHENELQKSTLNSEFEQQ